MHTFVDIKINDEVYDWDQVINHSYNNIELISEAKNTTTIAIHPDITFMVTRAYGKAVGYFLGLYILKSRGLSSDCEGVIGKHVLREIMLSCPINNMIVIKHGDI